MAFQTLRIAISHEIIRVPGGVPARAKIVLCGWEHLPAPPVNDMLAAKRAT
jgi:hypothetical protein